MSTAGRAHQTADAGGRRVGLVVDGQQVGLVGGAVGARAARQFHAGGTAQPAGRALDDAELHAQTAGGVAVEVTDRLDGDGARVVGVGRLVGADVHGAHLHRLGVTVDVAVEERHAQAPQVRKLVLNARLVFHGDLGIQVGIAQQLDLGGRLGLQLRVHVGIAGPLGEVSVVEEELVLLGDREAQAQTRRNAELPAAHGELDGVLVVLVAHVVVDEEVLVVVVHDLFDFPAGRPGVQTHAGVHHQAAVVDGVLDVGGAHDRCTLKMSSLIPACPAAASPATTADPRAASR